MQLCLPSKKTQTGFGFNCWNSEKNNRYILLIVSRSSRRLILLFQISTAIRKSRKNEAIVILLLSRVFFVFELLQLEYFPKIKLKIEVSSFKALFPSFELFKAASNSQFKLWYFNKDSEENTHDFTPPLPNWNYRFIHSTYKSL